MNDTVAGFWGDPNSSINWCERDYDVSFMVAEFWNTVSNLPFIVFGLMGAHAVWKSGGEARYIAQFFCVSIVGVGSALFHGTLRYVQQQSDELPMVWTILTWLYTLYMPDIQDHPYAPLVPGLLFVYALAFSIIHWIYAFTTVFQAHFLVLSAIYVRRIYLEVKGISYSELRETNPDDKYQKLQLSSASRAKRAAWWYAVFLAAGYICWNVDYHFCNTMQGLPVNPQGHAWWHVFMALACHYVSTIVVFSRAPSMGRRAVIEWTWGFIPHARYLPKDIGKQES